MQAHVLARLAIAFALLQIAIKVEAEDRAMPARQNRSGFSAPRVTRAQSPEIPPSPMTESTETKAAPPKTSTVDAGQIALGQSAFQNRCIQCHDADKSTQKRKSFSGWRATVLRMSEKDGAEVPSHEVDPIAHYLTSLNPTAGQAEGGGDNGGDDEQNFTLFGTLSPTWRGGNSDLQNAGFVPDVWAGVAWQSSNSAISAKATACFSCHSEAGLGSRIELVEAAVRLDLGFLLTGCKATRLKSSIEAGRLIVPFGAFSQQSNPGVYRTVSKPLIYNMGLRVSDENYGDPVLPMPYADEGAKIDFDYELTDQINATFDFYAVNGLQGADDGIDFDMSRDYVDNNRRPAVGGRATIGSSWLRLGTSYMGGTFSPTGGTGPANSNLNYSIFGFDVQSRYKDILRFQFEYARRDSDRIVALPNQLLNADVTEGGYFETECLLVRKWKLSALARYDWQHKQSPVPPPGSNLLVGDFTVHRVTSGINKVLPGGSLLMFNHEYWIFPQGNSNVHVWAVRWAASF